MELHEILIFALIWGGLMLYFLTTFHKNTEPQEMKNIPFSQAFKKSFIQVVLHKKAIFAGILLIVTIFYFWFYYGSIAVYKQVLGESEIVLLNPREHAIYYVIGICFYTGILYLSVVLNGTDKYLKSSSKKNAYFKN